MAFTVPLTESPSRAKARRARVQHAQRSYPF